MCFSGSRVLFGISCAFRDLACFSGSRVLFGISRAFRDLGCCSGSRVVFGISVAWARLRLQPFFSSGSSTWVSCSSVGTAAAVAFDFALDLGCLGVFRAIAPSFAAVMQRFIGIRVKS